MKKICVIMSVYNCEKFLDDSLSSLQNQTLDKEDFEAIIINDGSTDSSIKIIKKYLKNNKNWHLIDRENKGLSISRNEGLDMINSEYVTFFDSDDISENDALENMYKELKQSKSDIGIFRTTSFNNSGVYKDSYTQLLDTLSQCPNIKDNILLFRIIRSVGIVYKMDLVRDIRFIPAVVHEDNYFCIKAYSKAKNIYISRTEVYKIRRTSDNDSITSHLNFKTFNDLVLNIKTADCEVKNIKLIKLHINQMLSYIKKHLEISEKSKAVIEIKKYLLELQNNKVISNFEYCYYLFYLYFKKVIN